MLEAADVILDADIGSQRVDEALHRDPADHVIHLVDDEGLARQGDPIAASGPFIGDSQDAIRRLYAEYRSGRFERMSELARLAPAQ